MGWQTSWTEILGAATGALCVWLVARQHIANWPIGIANNVFFIVLFAQAGLYADAGLQIVFIALAAYGWWSWTHGGGPGTAEALPVRRTTGTEWAALAAAGAVGVLALTLLLDGVTDSTVPFWDALATGLSLMATYGQCRKLLESWWLWIATDLVSVPLYVHKGLYVTAVLYVGFLTLCVTGLIGWRRALSATEATDGTDGTGGSRGRTPAVTA
ncbi:nicotinamide riboside transporter PnuC [Streptomyces sp. NPDC102278]|uniref:nicotinamide riboside transporter PnuC n=1 Tax=Streptomyces sp. NPDC102278 TaxID=3366152 RepID=UPI00380F5948